MGDDVKYCMTCGNCGFIWQESEEAFTGWVQVACGCKAGELFKRDREKAETLPLANGGRGLILPEESHPIDAGSYLLEAGNILGQRGNEYDRPDGERSMARIVAAFNAVRGKDLSEADGWAFMICLKQVRAATSPKFHRDSHVDMVAYAALLAECEAKG